MTTSVTDRAAEPTSTHSPPRYTAKTWLRSKLDHAGRWPKTAVAMGSLSTVLLLVQAYAIATIAQQLVIERAPFAHLYSLFVLLPAAMVLRGLCLRFKTIASARAGIQVRQAVRAELLSSIATRSPMWVRSQHSATLGSHLCNDVDALDGYYADYVPQMYLCGIIPLIIIVAVMPLNWAAGVILLITGPMIPLNMAMVGMGAKNLQQAQIVEMGRLSRHFLDTVRCLPTLKLFGLGKRQARSVERVSEDFRKRSMKVLKLAFLSSTALEFFSSVSIAILAIYIGFVYLGQFHFGNWGGSLSLQAGLFILILAPEFYQPLRDLGTHYHAKAAAEASAEVLMPIESDANEHTESVSSSTSDWNSQAPVSISFNGVTAHYPNRAKAALEDVSFALEAGQTLAVIGPSGAGKSTLLSALMGFLPLTKGEIRCNQQSLAQLPRDQWHRSLGWVGQHSAIIKGSLADNLCMGAHASIEKEMLWDALEKVHLKAWVESLPHQLDTPIGEGGQPISGGQARRLSVARALIRNAPLTLLDEPTASLDADSERLVIDALRALKQQRSLVILTHRLELLKLADHIVMLDDGHITAQGSFTELSAEGGPLHPARNVTGGAP
ncbi:thiol reductant ABC exporter subunit CydD [Carnimonas bestiolae]|uniref:thiol reductant ABC exporter subunit CydD n=1 Tax=Carnimonas bestiolae TaxID=3402172 RepID=UPI003EDBBA9D